MEKIASLLKEEDTLALIEHYASLDDSIAFDSGLRYAPSLIDAGRRIALAGLPDKPQTRCAECHGERGEGNGDSIPRLAGQNKVYIVRQLNNWQSGQRSTGQEVMKGIAEQLTDEQAMSVASFFESLGWQ